ncbi:MAG TPA: transglycosylase SLT domain-containing protein [Candidatus Nanopelagicales bacterium]|nr:transglycosylase SLT domain-containing protein [Candidatus Nanopelagicales bacterium]
MSFVHKIPPMVSALAFGYGVGMAAPDAAITPVRAAVAVYQQGAPPPRSMEAVPGGTVQARGGRTVEGEGRAAVGAEGALPARRESHELGRLREAQARERGEGAACEIERPTYSEPPRRASSRDGYVEDVEDLDTAGAEALSRLQMSDLPVTITRRTIKYVRFFTRSDRGRGMFETWLKRSGRYQELVQQTLREWRLPEDLIWLAMIESGFDPRARSPAGAVGLWQFMPATGEVYGLAQDRFMDQRKNPRLATQAAAHHLRDLYQRFGDWNLALAAYNMGYEQLLDRIDRYGTADFNELARQGALPQETASYVPKIAAAALVANNLERFGFEGVKLARPLDAAEMAVPPGTPLKALAKAAGVSTATLRTLNPDLLQDRVPPGRGDYLVMIPAESLARAQASLSALLDAEPLANDAAVLNPVDLLGGRDFTRQASGEGSLLSLLPKPKRRALRDPLEALAQDDGGDRDEDEIAPRRSAKKKRQLVMYKVGQGDTLIGVARQFAVDVEDLARDNGLDTDARLREGALLRLRVRPDLLERPASAAAEPEGAPAAGPSERRVTPAAPEPPREGAGQKGARGRKGRS